MNALPTASLSALLVLIFMGSALGGATRHAISVWFSNRLGNRFPIGTMVVNITGAFLIGFLWAFPWDVPLLLLSPETGTLMVFGFLGGYTTVSSFSLQTLAMLQTGDRRSALFNISGSVVFCLAAVATGAAVAPW